VSSDSAQDDSKSSSDLEFSDALLGGETGGDDLERLAARVPPVNILLLGPPLARSLTFDIGVRFRGGDGGRVSPQSLLSCRPHSDAVLYSSSDEKTTDLEDDSVHSKLNHKRILYEHKNATCRAILERYLHRKYILTSMKLPPFQKKKKINSTTKRRVYKF